MPPLIRVCSDYIQPFLRASPNYMIFLKQFEYTRDRLKLNSRD